MTELANLLPAMIGLVIAVVALVSAHVAKRHLEAQRRTKAGAEPLLTGFEAAVKTPMVYGGGGDQLVKAKISSTGTLFERMSTVARAAATSVETKGRR